MQKKLNYVLIIDDNDSDNFIHKKIIEKSGITDRVEISLNGQEALDFLTGQGKFVRPEGSFSQPDLIFLDINMPIMDGWEFLDEYRKLADIHKAKVIVIMLTTSLNPADITRSEKTLGSGCYQFKPLTLQMIDKIMEEYFPD